MPYSGASDPKLPSNVQKMTATKRAQWVHVWNSAYKSCQSKDGADCEAAAFRQANGVAKKSLDDTWDIWSRQLSQSVAEYTPTGGGAEKACSSCHWFSSPDGCILVSGDIASNGLCSQWRMREEYVSPPMPVEVTNWADMGAKGLDEGCLCLACTAEDDSGPMGVKARWTTGYVATLPDSSFALVSGEDRHFPYKDAAGHVDIAHLRHALAHVEAGSKALGPLCAAAKAAGIQGGACESSSKGLIAAVKSWFINPNGPSKEGSAPNSPLPVAAGLGQGLGLGAGAVRVTKALGADGEAEYRAFLIYSNNFMDRHGQIIREAAHKDYADWVEEKHLYPEFWLWHTEGTTWGQADTVDQIGHFMVASGPVHKGYEHIAETLAATDGIAVSFGFFKEETPDKKEVTRYRAFEVSPLPIEHAANIWTGADFVKGADMALTEARKQFFKDVGVSPEFLASLENGLVNEGTQIAGAGVAHKEATTEPGASAGTEGAAAGGEGAPAAAGGVVSVDMVLGMMQQIMEPMVNTLGQVQAAQKSLGERLDKSVAELAEDANLAQIARLPRGYKATEDPATVLAGSAGAAPGESLHKDFDWIAEEPVFQDMFRVPGPTGVGAAAQGSGNAGE